MRRHLLASVERLGIEAKGLEDEQERLVVNELGVVESSYEGEEGGSEVRKPGAQRQRRDR